MARTLALTLDDGPNTEGTERLLELLARPALTATSSSAARKPASIPRCSATALVAASGDAGRAWVWRA
ncbi:MAG TPA: hypothetical protein VGG41_16640 [Solirubrobacteraceae bacterium]